MWIGTVSDGIYLYHEFIAFAWRAVAPGIGWPVYAVLSSASVLIAGALSWRFVEKPINDLKRHFPYGERMLDRASSAIL